MREYVVTCCSTADMSRTFMETNEVPFAMFHYQLMEKNMQMTCTRPSRRKYFIK